MDMEEQLYGYPLEERMRDELEVEGAEQSVQPTESENA